VSRAGSRSECRLKLLDPASVVDVFVCSCFVRLRKPDTDVFRLACDLTQVAPQEVVYIEDRASGIVIRGIDTTRPALAELGL
jgi:putative hydrolase of the HAD superfamily